MAFKVKCGRCDEVWRVQSETVAELTEQRHYDNIENECVDTCDITTVGHTKTVSV